jgi:ribose transport system substrate-binding protein
MRRVAALVAVGVLAAACSTGGSSSASAGASGAAGPYTIGVSNTLVGNGWREGMICSVKAQALASGVVDRVIVANRNGGPTEQIADIENLISQGVDAIIINPSSRTDLDAAIKAATDQGIVVVAVDQAVDEPTAYVATNDQVAYGRLGAEWLFNELGGEGNVVEMRGIDGVPADTDRHEGFMAALANFPDITVVQETFTGWDWTQGSDQAIDVLNTEEVDGIWTSGIDHVVVTAFDTVNQDAKPVVGADNNGFIKQLIDGSPGAVVTNPSSIGGVGTAIALDVLQGETVERETILTPEVWTKAENAAELDANYIEGRDPTWSSQVQVEPWTTYTAEQYAACKGPGE